METFEIGGERYSVEFFKSHTMEECQRYLPHERQDRIINVWKQINGKSVRSKKELKPDKTED